MPNRNSQMFQKNAYKLGDAIAFPPLDVVATEILWFDLSKWVRWWRNFEIDMIEILRKKNKHDVHWGDITSRLLHFLMLTCKKNGILR